MNSKGEIADKDGVLIDMRSEPDTIKMENLELPDVPFKGSKYVGTKQEMLDVMKAPEIPAVSFVSRSPSKLEGKGVEVISHIEEEKDEEEEMEESLENEWVDMIVDEETENMLNNLLG